MGRKGWRACLSGSAREGRNFHPIINSVNPQILL
jgi:hypothetical protein